MLTVEEIMQQMGVSKEAAEEALARLEKLGGFADKFTPEQLAGAKWKGRAALARKDNPQGFRNFFWCVYGKELPLHAYYGFIVPIYWAHGRLTRNELDLFYKEKNARKFQFIYDKIKNERVPKRGIIIRAAREFAKTIVISTAFQAFQIGQRPERMYLLVQLAEDSAKDNSSKIAEIIEKSPAWKEIFPNVVPDKERGWGAGGYSVMRTDIDASEWVKLCSDRNAPTMLGVGYKSSEIIGKHPNGGAVIDDIHDESNTSSDKELKSTKAKLRSDFVYAPTSEAWWIMVGTPWVEDDALDDFSKTGEFVVVDIPAYLEVRANATTCLPETDWQEDGKYIYLWNKERGANWVRAKKNISPPPEFARMVQLNIRRAESKQFKYQTFPHKDIKWQEWPVSFGIDPINVINMVAGREGGTSHFACAYALRTPFNSVVIGDGILAKVDRSKAEEMVADAARGFPTFRGATIETDGGGIAFAAMVRNMGISVIPCSTSDIKKLIRWTGTGKAERQYQFLERLLNYGAVTISDGDSEFLSSARRWLDKFPNLDRKAKEWDVGDAIVLAIYGIPEIWTTIIGNAEAGIKSVFEKRERKKSAWSGALGGVHA